MRRSLELSKRDLSVFARVVRGEETVDPIETEDEEDERLREEKDGVTYASMEGDAPDSA